MRCKNCGADNNDNRYICEVCGSPLYDENELDVNNGIQDNERTQVFGTIKAEPTQTVKATNTAPVNSDGGNNKNDENKKGIIIIAVLSVILVAIIISVVAIAHNNNNKETTAESELTKISTTNESMTSEKPSTTEDTTKESTTEETTTEESTTEAPVKWIINASSSGGGEVEGDGEYENGDKVTLIARADDGYVFDGWYSNGIKVSDSTKYTFSANENASFSAVFSEFEPEPEPEPQEEPTDEEPDEINFGD